MSTMQNSSIVWVGLDLGLYLWWQFLYEGNMDFKYCWKRTREPPECFPLCLALTQLLPNSSSLPHQSLGFLAMQALCPLLLLSIPLPIPLKAEGMRWILELNQTQHIKPEKYPYGHTLAHWKEKSHGSKVLWAQQFPSF